MDATDSIPPDLTKNSVVLFTVLEAARRKGDFAKADAQRQLAEQGIRATYAPAKVLSKSRADRRSDGR